MNKIVAFCLLFVVGCSAKPKVKTIKNVTPKSSAVTFIDRIEKINPISENISIQQYDERGNIKVFNCRGCHIECKHCVEQLVSFSVLKDIENEQFE